MEDQRDNLDKTETQANIAAGLCSILIGLACLSCLYMSGCAVSGIGAVGDNETVQAYYAGEIALLKADKETRKR